MCTEQEGTKRDKGDRVERYRRENKTRMMRVYYIDVLETHDYMADLIFFFFDSLNNTYGMKSNFLKSEPGHFHKRS